MYLEIFGLRIFWISIPLAYLEIQDQLILEFGFSVQVFEKHFSMFSSSKFFSNGVESVKFFQQSLERENLDIEVQ